MIYDLNNLEELTKVFHSENKSFLFNQIREFLKQEADDFLSKNKDEFAHLPWEVKNIRDKEEITLFVPSWAAFQNRLKSFRESVLGKFLSIVLYTNFDINNACIYAGDFVLIDWEDYVSCTIDYFLIENVIEKYNLHIPQNDVIVQKIEKNKQVIKRLEEENNTFTKLFQCQK